MDDETQVIGIGMLQRRLGVKYTVASDMVAALRAAGMVGEPVKTGSNLYALKPAKAHESKERAIEPGLSERLADLVEDLHSRLISANAYALTDRETSRRSLATALGTCLELRKCILANDQDQPRP